MRPGIRPWFDHAAVRTLALERLTDVRARSVEFEEAFPGSGATGQDPREAADERGVWIPHHLKDRVIPPRSSSVGIPPSVTRDAIKED